MALNVRDYKQFAGEHQFIPPKSGVIGIVGENGAGKSTLFEAIEWCLYQPRAITAADIFPRVIGGQPFVSVTMLDEITGRPWKVDRWLSKAGLAGGRITADARIVVEGGQAVTKYVQSQMIGLGHKAFVSTFFTRQKELTFFGQLGETDRRREVGKLLGLETIRDAQKAIGDERSTAQTEARLAEAQYDRETEGRDLDEEIDAATGQQISARETVSLRQEETVMAESEWEVARSQLAAHSDLQRQDIDLGEQKRAAEAECTAAQAMLTSAIESLARLAQLEIQVPEHTRLADLAHKLRFDIDNIEAQAKQRTAFERATERLTRAEQNELQLTQSRTARLARITRAAETQAAYKLITLGDLPVRPGVDICPICDQPIAADKAAEIHEIAVQKYEAKIKQNLEETRAEVDRLSRLLVAYTAMARSDMQIAKIYATDPDSDAYEPALELIACLEEQTDARSDCADLHVGPVDGIALADLREQLSASAAAERSLELIAKMAEARPTAEEQIKKSTADAKAATKKVLAAEKARIKLDYNSAAHTAAHGIERAAITAYKVARDEQIIAASQANEAVAKVTAAVAEKERLTALLAYSLQLINTAAIMDLMYREMSQFEQFVAETIVPQLDEYTSEIVDAVTQGKYNRVEFSGNYSIEVFDDDLGYPLAEFSGGERDVVSLAARMALSRLIGRQAVCPPGFMVLDEVFGSLDRDRRERTLEMLDTLVGSESAFKQLFVISHVDDVQSSRIFDAVWRAHETESGSSAVEQLDAI